MAPRRAAVDVSELPGHAVDVGDGQVLHRRVSLEVERREDGVGAEPRDGESAAVVGVGGSESLREGHHPVAFVGAAVSRLRNCGGEIDERVEEELGEDLVGEWIGEELDGGDATENEWPREELMGEVLRR